MQANKATTISLAIVTTGITVGAVFRVWRTFRRHERSKYIVRDEHEREQIEQDQNDTLPSIFSHFQEMKLDYGSSIEEANKRRTSVYYEKARDSHLYDLVPGVRSYIRLRNRREAEIKRIMKYYKEKNKSHRTVIVMCDDDTAKMLEKARKDILEPLNWTSNEATSAAWIPELNIIPQEHLHVTVASVWWWHTIRENNRALTEEAAARFRQALVLEFHHAFQIELERIVLLGGKALVALWRCIGERRTKDGTTIYDRHGEEPDPFVKLRRDIVKSFTNPETGDEPLTYTHRVSTKGSPFKDEGGQKLFKNAISRTEPMLTSTPVASRENVERQNTIELKTPGLNNSDGFIHTTLARLPLNCLSMSDTELGPIHRLCREATATYCGHRMVVSKFRFLETTGAGGESNPCVEPIFDETIDAPIRVEVTGAAGVIETRDLHDAKNVESHATIGALPNAAIRGSVNGLFEFLEE